MTNHERGHIFTPNLRLLPPRQIRASEPQTQSVVRVGGVAWTEYIHLNIRRTPNEMAAVCSKSQARRPPVAFLLFLSVGLVNTLLLVAMATTAKPYSRCLTPEPATRQLEASWGESANEAIKPKHIDVEEKCAINLYGLPRAFQSLVLPSLIQNVIQPNKANCCDYFVHYYNVTAESAGRSGRGGGIDASEILLLEQAVRDVHSDSDDGCFPMVRFAHDTDASFQSNRRSILKDLTTTTQETSERNIYIPPGFSVQTAMNIIKMWHSIDAVWDLMQQQQQLEASMYSRVAMLRADVFFATPVNVWHAQHQQHDTNNTIAIVPGFGLYPVSDRMIYGPSAAVQVWAQQRFQRLPAYLEYLESSASNDGIHSEKYVNHTIFPAIRQTGTIIQEHDTLCFFRARADESVWISDCRNLMSRKQQVPTVEKILNRTCTGGRQRVPRSPVTEGRTELHCPMSKLELSTT